MSTLYHVTKDDAMKYAIKSLSSAFFIFSAFFFCHTYTIQLFNFSYFTSNNNNIQYSKTYTLSPNAAVSLYGENSTVTVDVWDKNTFKLDAKATYPPKNKQDPPYTIEKNKQDLTIKTINTSYTSLEYHLLMPRNTKLKVMNTKGNITLSGAGAPADLETTAGSIKVENASSGLTAKAPAGSVSIEQNELHNDQHIFVQAQKKIKMTLAPSISANLKAHAPKGRITSDQSITLDPITMKLKKKNWKNLQKNVSGKIGSGGSSIILESDKGSIHLAQDI